MTPSFVPEHFDRVMGCTSADLLSWLPRALPWASLALDAARSTCTATLPEGSLLLTWTPLPATRIALLVIPRLNVRFDYTGLAPEQRYKVQKRFDLETLRGGG